MRVYDLLLLLLIGLPPVAHYWHGRRMLAKGRSITQVAGVSAAYGFVPVLSLFYVIGTDFGKRLYEATGFETIMLVAIWGPLTIGQWLHLYPVYILDRQARQVDWSFMEFVRANGRIQVLMTGLILPMPLVTPLFELLIPEPDDATAIALMVALLLAGGLLAFLGWRWTKIQYQPVEPALLERLSALCEQLGLRPRAIQVMPTRGGKVANAFVMGFKPGRSTILLTDYLIETCSPEQIEVILAHEIGHAKLGHVRKRIWMAAGSAVLILALAFGWVFLVLMPLKLPAIVEILPMMLFGYLPPLMMMPAFRRQEFEADRWAAEATGRGAELAATLEHLDQLNQLEFEKLPRWLRLLMGHPITRQRAMALRGINS